MSCEIALTVRNRDGLYVGNGVKCDMCDDVAVTTCVHAEPPQYENGKLVLKSKVTGYYCLKHNRRS